MPNGLEVIVVENHGVPLVTVEITVRNGSFTQTPEYAGLAHMFEHMFFKANDAYPFPDQFMDRGSEMGAVFNASTKEEQVNYYLTLSADSMEAGMKFLVSALHRRRSSGRTSSSGNARWCSASTIATNRRPGSSSSRRWERSSGTASGAGRTSSATGRCWRP